MDVGNLHCDSSLLIGTLRCEIKYNDKVRNFVIKPKMKTEE